VIRDMCIRRRILLSILTFSSLGPFIGLLQCRSAQQEPSDGVRCTGTIKMRHSQNVPGLILRHEALDFSDPPPPSVLFYHTQYSFPVLSHCALTCMETSRGLLSPLGLAVDENHPGDMVAD
jgi:hypothetical protein